MDYPRIRTAIWDIETDGLLDKLTRVHCLVIRDFERRATYRFRRNDVMDNVDEGLDLLEQAEINVGFNTIQFDIPALCKVYDGIAIQGKVRDALVMARMVFADEKERDFRRFERGKIPGKLIGSHTLEAWGHRLGMHKGDYKVMMEARAKEMGITDPEAVTRFVWGTWNQDMEDYCDQDVNVTAMFWDRVLRMGWDENSTIFEHTIHDLMGQQERNGIHFNVPAATKLAEELEDEAHRLAALAVEHYGKWWKPAKKWIIAPLWDDPEGLNAKRAYESPRKHFGEDKSRKVWGDVTVPKKRVQYADVLRGTYDPEAPYCKIVLQQFNPASRPQIIDRFGTVYDWHPVDFTETGQPEVSDDVLRVLAKAKNEDGTPAVPMALELAEVFYYNKRLGQIKTGANAWLKKVTPEGKIHHYCNVGGTISGRASHVGPNLGQVPKVKILPLLDADGNPVLNAKGKAMTRIGYGREGDHGYECRSLFYVPEPWGMTGADLKGIELRCFGEKLRQYDDGDYLKIVLTGDIHYANQMLAELPSRDNAKTFIYALLYGAGDIKLGSIVAPLESEEEQRAIGAKLRARFMENLPAYALLVKEIKRYASKGFIPGLDGRRLYVRSRHSALNTWLQSDAALIAKKWVCLTEDYLIDEGLVHGWDGDFAQLLWIHDEIQIASRGLGHIVEQCTLRAAKDAGLHFGYECPVEAEAKHGNNWAQTH